VANGKLKGNRAIKVEDKVPTANLLLAMGEMADADVEVASAFQGTSLSSLTPVAGRLGVTPSFRRDSVNLLRRFDGIGHRHVETAPAVVAIPVITLTSLIDPDGIPREASGAAADRDWLRHGALIDPDAAKCCADDAASSPPLSHSHTRAGTSRSRRAAHRDASNDHRDGCSSCGLPDCRIERTDGV
jgi:hypothetical protein